jgi:two-component system sensor histidine kinase RpfC
VSRDSRLDEHGSIISLTGLAAWFAVAIGIFASIRIWPAPSVTRRVLGMLADVGAVTFALILTGESGVVLVGAYLFIIFGNGFRFGRVYFHVSQIFSLMGFVLVLLMAPWWQHELVVGMSWLLWMIVLPFYVGVLAERINQARLRAEEALKECIERERRGS